MKIIPAIDIMDGKCVRLTQGNYELRNVYSESPLDVARKFEDHGLKYLHIVDLDGARSSQIVHGDLLEEIATKTNLQIDFGGGIKSNSSIQRAFDCGAAKVVIGSIAVQQPEIAYEWLRYYGQEKIVLGADCRHRYVATMGWTRQSDVDIAGFINQYYAAGIREIICTDIVRDGMLQGPAISLYREIISDTKVGLIASGGVRTIQDLHDLQTVGCTGVIIGKALYEGHISLQQLQELC